MSHTGLLRALIVSCTLIAIILHVRLPRTLGCSCLYLRVLISLYLHVDRYAQILIFFLHFSYLITSIFCEINHTKLGLYHRGKVQFTKKNHYTTLHSIF